jgi:hypothetical protein
VNHAEEIIEQLADLDGEDSAAPLAVPSCQQRQDFDLAGSVGFPLDGQIVGPIPVAEILG